MTPSKEQVMARLSAIPIFSDMTVENLETLAHMVQYRRFPRGAFIVGQHESGSSMYLLISGRVKVSLASPEGKELVLNYLEAPTHFGEMALVDQSPRAASATAETDCSLLAINRKEFLALVRTKPAFEVSLLRALAKRFRYMTVQQGQV